MITTSGKCIFKGCSHKAMNEKRKARNYEYK